MTLQTSILSRIEEIRSDNTSGAETLMQRSANLFLWLAENLNARDAGELFLVLRETAKNLVAAQPAMVGIFNLANRILLSTDGIGELKAMRDALIGTAIAMVRSSDESLQAIAPTAASLVQSGQTVATHSFSITVFQALLEAKKSGKDFTVICTESRPMMEGITLARQLGQAGIRVNLVTDAAVFGLLERVGIVFLGVDSIGTEGWISKAGSKAIALVAKHYDVRCYALCSTHKFVPPGHKLLSNVRGDPREILQEQSKNIIPLNPYFDLNPLESLTGVITEVGIQKLDAIREDFANLKIHPLLQRESSTLLGGTPAA